MRDAVLCNGSAAAYTGATLLAAGLCFRLQLTCNARAVLMHQPASCRGCCQAVALRTASPTPSNAESQRLFVEAGHALPADRQVACSRLMAAAAAAGPYHALSGACPLTGRFGRQQYVCSHRTFCLRLRACVWLSRQPAEQQCCLWAATSNDSTAETQAASPAQPHHAARKFPTDTAAAVFQLVNSTCAAPSADTRPGSSGGGSGDATPVALLPLRFCTRQRQAKGVRRGVSDA